MMIFGKLLVLLNFALSVAILAVALASYGNPVDFTNSPGVPKDNIPPGLFKQRADKLRDAWDKIPPALAGMRKADNSLALFERYKNAHQFFKEELEFLRTGATPAAPARLIKYNLAVPEVDPRDPGKLTMVPAVDSFGKPLASMKFYEGRIEKLAKEIKDQEERYRKGVEDERTQTEKRLGGKGYQQRLIDQQAMLAQAKEESTRMEPLWVNASVESELILKRRASLESRLDELKKLESTAGPALSGRTP